MHMEETKAKLNQDRSELQLKLKWKLKLDLVNYYQIDFLVKSSSIREGNHSTM